MSDKTPSDDKIIEGHEYDGIRELDHPLPRWWVYLFYATIVYAVAYYSYYEILGGPSHQEQYESAMAEISQRAKQVPTSDEAPSIDIETLVKDQKALEIGQAAFKQYCAACHGQSGEGVIGPNLTDNYWIHSKGKFPGIMAAIINGFPSKGMPPWGDVIPKDKHGSLAAYVLSIQGSRPDNPKAAQGELVE